MRCRYLLNIFWCMYAMQNRDNYILICIHWSLNGHLLGFTYIEYINNDE